jgi:hypothetical protein
LCLANQTGIDLQAALMIKDGFKIRDKESQNNDKLK